jgi:hypothetical protein
MERIEASAGFLAVIVLVACSFAGTSMVAAQEFAGPPREGKGLENWTHLYEEEGVTFSFIFYRKGDNEHNGVVVRLDNTNSYPVRYEFTMVFRSDTSRVVAPPKSGVLGPGEMKTGSSDGLWWIPFTDGREISEVGMRAMNVSRAAQQ